MSVVKQLYQLQEIDLELESNEQALRQISSQLGQSETVIKTRNKLDLAHQHLEDLSRQQHSIEWEIEDLDTKLTTTEKELYSGRIGSPKELTNLQHEINGLKANRNQLEEKTLEMMDQVELTTKNIASIDSKLKTLEAEWKDKQKQLSAQLEQVKNALSNLNQKRQLLIDGADHEAVEVYQALRKQRGTAVARVEQGICCGCRISLPVTELRRARSDSLVRCSSCGRILFLA